MNLNILSFLFLFVMATSAKTIKCSDSKHCPKDQPCCSQFGECGTGAYCLGGCDIRYSYNLSACMPMPRMDSFNTTFKSTKQVELTTKYMGKADDSDWVYTGYLDTHDDALLLQMPNQSTGTVVSSTKYIWYGKISAKLKTSRGRGVITAFILFSDVKDEIDYEFVGYNLTSPQTNYYYEGITNYTNVKNSSSSDTFKNWHDYEIDWQEDKIDWYIDGDKVRTLEKKDTYNTTSKEYMYPQTPSRIQFSLWPGGAASNGIGTIEWAGGAVDWDSDDIKKYGYYYMYVKDVKVEAYDLPDGVKLVGGTNEHKLDSFLYNSTDGGQKNVMLTNKKTWLGDNDAVGWAPDNDDDDEETTISESGSKSTKKASKTTEISANVPTRTATGGGNGNGNGNAAATTSIKYNPSAGIGGFIQNSSPTSDSTDGKSSSGKSSSGGSRNIIEAFVTFISALGLTFVF